MCFLTTATKCSDCRAELEELVDLVDEVDQDAADSVLQGAGHPVERVGEGVEVGVGLALQPRVETPTGDRLGGRTHAS